MATVDLRGATGPTWDYTIEAGALDGAVTEVQLPGWARVATLHARGFPVRYLLSATSGGESANARAGAPGTPQAITEGAAGPTTHYDQVAADSKETCRLRSPGGDANAPPSLMVWDPADAGAALHIKLESEFS